MSIKLRRVAAVRTRSKVQHGQGDGVKWRVWFCEQGDIHMAITAPDGDEFEFSLMPESAYDLARDVTHAYDVANGISAIPNWTPPS